jgi:YHS domain-containing protein/thioredoxin-related protein
MRRETPGPLRLVVISSLALCGAFGNVARTGAAETPSISWRNDYARAMAEARAKNRAVWIQFTGPWCPWCVRMEHDTFPDPKVVGLTRDTVVPILLRSDLHEEIALRYGLSGLPATILVNPQGEVLAKHEGYLDPATFHAYVVSALDRFGLRRRPGETPKAATESLLALGGYCPVSLVSSHQLVAGKPEWTLRHDGRLYRFASDEARSRFKKQPELFAPVNGGQCPVTQVNAGKNLAGDPRSGVLYEGHLYLCADEATRKQFLERPERYSHVDVADRGFCPHCWTHDNLLVRGRVEHSLTRSGRRYFFPDATHLEAFRASPDTARR